MSKSPTREQIFAAAKLPKGRKQLHAMREIVQEQLRVADAQLTDFQRARQQTQETLQHINDALREVQA